MSTTISLPGSASKGDNLTVPGSGVTIPGSSPGDELMRQIGAALTNFRDNAPPGPDPSAFDFEGSTPVGDVTIPGADSTLGAGHSNSLTLGGAGKIEVPPDWTVALLGNQAVIVNATGSTILSTGSIGGSFSGDNVTVVASTGDNDVS